MQSKKAGDGAGAAAPGEAAATPATEAKAAAPVAAAAAAPATAAQKAIDVGARPVAVRADDAQVGLDRRRSLGTDVSPALQADAIEAADQSKHVFRKSVKRATPADGGKKEQSAGKTARLSFNPDEDE